MRTYLTPQVAQRRVYLRALAHTLEYEVVRPYAFLRVYAVLKTEFPLTCL